MTAQFETGEQREEFMERLQALIEEYPFLMSRMRREYDEDPTAPHWDCCEDHPPYNSENERFVNGIVLIFGTTDITGWEDSQRVSSFNQPHALTIGLLRQNMW